MSSPYNPPVGESFDPERVTVQKLSQARAMAKDCASRPRPDETPGAILVSMTGAWKRWAVFEDHGEYVSVSLIGTEIMRFYARFIEFRTSVGSWNWPTAPQAREKGFNTVLTRKVINNLLPSGAKFRAAQTSGPVTLKGDKVLYRVHPGDEPVEVSGQELRVGYTGKVVVTTEPSNKGVPRARKVKEPVAA